MSNLDKTQVQKGFSIPELLLVISIFAIIGAASYPIIQNFSDASAFAEGKARAEALTAAKILFYKTDVDAEKDWDKAKKDEDYFGLLNDYLYSGSDMELADFASEPPYDTFDFGEDVRSKVKLDLGDDDDDD